ncbi:MAG: PG0541 family transporter-associated protein [Syntrophothermus sp.]
MKIVFMVYHDVLDDRVDVIQKAVGIDYFTKWEDVKGKGHNTDAHLGSRSFPGFNHVRMIGFSDEESLEKLINEVEKVNREIHRTDDKIRIFQIPVERIL